MILLECRESPALKAMYIRVLIIIGVKGFNNVCMYGSIKHMMHTWFVDIASLSIVSRPSITYGRKDNKVKVSIGH